jgi:hypothetical protein
MTSLVDNATCIGAMRQANRILVGKPEEKRPLVTTKLIWEDIIKKRHKDVM